MRAFIVNNNRVIYNAALLHAYLFEVGEGNKYPVNKAIATSIGNESTVSGVLSKAVVIVNSMARTISIQCAEKLKDKIFVVAGHYCYYLLLY